MCFESVVVEIAYTKRFLALTILPDEVLTGGRGDNPVFVSFFFMILSFLGKLCDVSVLVSIGMDVSVEFVASFSGIDTACSLLGY